MTIPGKGTVKEGILLSNILTVKSAEDVRVNEVHVLPASQTKKQYL